MGASARLAPTTNVDSKGSKSPARHKAQVPNPAKTASPRQMRSDLIETRYVKVLARRGVLTYWEIGAARDLKRLNGN